MFIEESVPCTMVKKPENPAAKVVLSMVNDICWKIWDKVPADMQEEVILKFFKALGSATNLEDLAAKAVKIVSPQNMKKEVEDNVEDDDADKEDNKDDEEDFVLDLYIS